MVQLFGIHFHFHLGKLVVNLGSTKPNVAALRIGLAILGVPIMLYAVPPKNNVLLFIIVLGFWELYCLFGKFQ